MVAEDSTQAVAEPQSTQDWDGRMINRTEAARGDRADVRAQKGLGKQWCEPGHECWQQKDRRAYRISITPQAEARQLSTGSSESREVVIKNASE